MIKIDKPTILERMILTLWKSTPEKLLHLWPTSVQALVIREGNRLLRLRIARHKRKEKGRKLRVNSQMEIIGKEKRKV